MFVHAVGFTYLNTVFWVDDLSLKQEGATDVLPSFEYVLFHNILYKYKHF